MGRAEVKWKVDLEVNFKDPDWRLKAALQAKNIMADHSSLTNVFMVNGEKVDLDPTFPDFDEFTESYIFCALWQTKDENDVPLSFNYSKDDIDPDSLKRIVFDCQKFQLENYLDIKDHLVDAGRLFWLSRTGESGFAGRESPFDLPISKILHEAADAFGEVELEIDGEGKIHLFEI